MEPETANSVKHLAHPMPNRSGANRWNLSLALRIEWIGQTFASLCWIVSVFAYGISSLGDQLQLAAASFWLIANIAALYCSTDNS